MAADLRAIRNATVDLLDALGLDDWRNDPHLTDTPKRVARAWVEFIDYDPGNTDTVFAVDRVDQMVAVSGIDVVSMCAHHLLPFTSRVAVGYLADDTVIGVSKIARMAHDAAHRLGTQEGLVARIADAMEQRVGPDVAVTASGVHMCMTMRGIRTPATMTTSVLRGRFRDNDGTRAEWLATVAPTGLR